MWSSSPILIPYKYQWPPKRPRPLPERPQEKYPPKPLMSLNTVRLAVEENIDQSSDDNPDLFRAGVVLVSAISVGTNADRIAKFTGYNRDQVREIGRRLRKNKLWSGHGFYIEPWFHKKTGIVAFILDCMIANGEIERVEDEKYQLVEVR